MTLEYEQFSTDEADDAVAGALYARESEHFHHALNVSVYSAMLLDKDLPKGKWRDRLTTLVAEARAEMQNIEGIRRALSAQLPDERREAAFARVAAKRAEQSD